MKKRSIVYVLALVAISNAAAHAQSSVPTPSQQQVDAVEECMRKKGVVLKEPPKGGQVVMTDRQRKIVELCATPVAQELMLERAGQ